jgi:DNA-binding NarL/FixJ family response regulator
MSPGIATKVLRLFQKFAPPDQNTTSSDSANLSKREKEILLLMMEGDNYHVIADKCFLSYDTVRTHVRSIYKKLHVASVNQAIVKAFKQRLI